MKLEKLYTLSQFVDYIWDYSLGDECGHPELEKFILVKKYNNFLKQPFKKEIFVNELEKPRKLNIPEPYLCTKMLAWQEAEKKVIFKNLKYINLQPSTTSNYWSLNGVKVMQESNTGYFVLNITLSDLAEVTNGELKTINLEI